MPTPEFLDRQGGCFITFVDGSGATRVIAFDATLSVRHSGRSEITDHPVLDIGTTSDNSRPKPRSCTIEAHVTNTPILAPVGVSGDVSPLDLPSPVRDLRAGAIATDPTGYQFGTPIGGGVTFGRSPVEVTAAQFGTTEGRTKAQVLQFPTPFDRVRDVWDELESLRVAGVEVSVVCRTTQYLRALIESVDGPEDPADALTLTIGIREITVATSEVVQVNPPVSEPRAQKPQDQGATGSYSLEDIPGTDSRRTSLQRTFNKLSDYFTGAVG